MTFRLRIAPEAAIQTAQVDAWWREQRPTASDLFWQELNAAFDHLEAAPFASSLYEPVERPNLRRLLLPRTRYWLYFTIEGDQVVVRALWHTARGQGPTLP